MARISTYDLDSKITGGDKWIGSDSGFYNKTKNFTPLKLADYFNSSEKIDSTNSLRFWYQTLDPFEERGIGTISFESEVGISVPFSGISSFLLSKNTEGTIYIYDFFNSLLESKILLHKADTINTYAIYEVVGIEEYDLNSDFLKVSVSFVRGNGGLLEDKSYLISVIDFALEAPAISNHSELNLDDGTNPHGTTKADVGLDNVDNTSDLDKPISNDTQSALDLKVPYTGATQDVDLGDYELKAGQVEFDTTPIGNTGVGVMRWNDADGTLDLGLKGGNVTLQVGQEQVVRVVNKTGSNLLESNYQAVRVNGAQGQRLKVALAQATNDLLSAETIGLVTENIDNNQEGFVTTSGLIRGINTTGSLQGETWADGDMLYLSPSVAGRITNIKPSAPNHLIVVGYVVHSHANNGSIFVKVDNGYELEELHNVTETNYTTPIDTDSVLTFDVNNSLWKRLSWANIKSNLKTYFDTIYQTALGFTPENVANKATNLTSPDNTKYPTTQAVVDGLATKQDTLTNPITGTGANGQVAFFNGTTTQTGDNGLFWDNTNKRLGVGTNVPQRKLDVNGDFRAGNLIIRPSSNLSVIENAGTGNSILFIRSGGTNPLVLNDVGGGVIIGVSATPGARLDVRAQGALSTDIAFRVRNSTDTQNFLVVNGAGDVSNSGAGGGETNTQFGINVGRNRTGNFNSLFGYQAGRNLTTGINNVLFGYNAGASITTQNANTLIGSRAGESTVVGNTVAVGTNALVLNQTGTSNVAIGTEALYYNTASDNTAVGNGAGNANTTGQRNNFFGYASGRGNKTGGYNVFIGVSSAFYSNGSNNVFLGDSSGKYQSDGITNMTSADNSVFIGKDVKANSSGQTNQIVIGHNAIGLGSNSVVLGNTSITRTALRGQTSINTDTIDASAQLQVDSTTRGFLPPRMTTTQRNAIASPAAGLIVYDTTENKHYGYNGTTWNAFY